MKKIIFEPNKKKILKKLVKKLAKKKQYTLYTCYYESTMHESILYVETIAAKRKINVTHPIEDVDGESMIIGNKLIFDNGSEFHFGNLEQGDEDRVNRPLRH